MSTKKPPQDPPHHATESPDVVGTPTKPPEQRTVVGKIRLRLQQTAHPKRDELSCAIEGDKNPEDWDGLAKEYDDEVFSITKSTEKRKRVVEVVKDDSKVFIAGCGSATYLQRELLLQKEVAITAGDFSQTMLSISSENFQHPNLQHVLCDTKDLPFKNEFDTVISTNSIVPPDRREVVAMYTSIYEALKTGGQFVAYLPSFTLCKEMLRKYPELGRKYESKMDYEQYRFQDTVGWQCFHTEELIFEELEQASFNEADISINEVRCENDEEAANLARLYGINIDLIKKEFSCFFVIAKK